MLLSFPCEVGMMGHFRSTFWPTFTFVHRIHFMKRLLQYFHATDGYGIFSMRINLGACRTHDRGSGTNKSAQELSQRDRKTVSRLVRQGVEPIVFGLEFRRSTHWATPPFTPLIVRCDDDECLRVWRTAFHVYNLLRQVLRGRGGGGGRGWGTGVGGKKQNTEDCSNVICLVYKCSLHFTILSNAVEANQRCCA